MTDQINAEPTMGNPERKSEDVPPTAASGIASSRIWTFLNSAFALWLLSSIAVGGGAWLFQQWRDAHEHSLSVEEKFERLNFEAAGRTAQYLSWVARHLSQKDGNHREFIKAAPPNEILQSVRVFADVPRSVKATSEDSPYIQDMLPEFKDRDLLSIYAELNLINLKAAPTISYFRLVTPISTDSAARNREPILQQKRAMVYADAMLALLEPGWLLDYAGAEYGVFKDRFSKAFLSEDIQKFGFPYLDCFDC